MKSVIVTGERKETGMVAANATVAGQDLLRYYDDDPGGPGATIEKEHAYREGFLAEARRVVREWACPPLGPSTGGPREDVYPAGPQEKTRGDLGAATEAARRLREHIREQYSVYRQGSQGPKTYLLGYLPGHEVPAARARGRHHALAYATTPLPDATTPPIDPVLLQPWLVAVEAWAASAIQPDAPVPPPTLMAVRAATAPLIPVVRNLDEFALACPVCGFEYVHPVAVECRSPGQANGHLLIDHQGIHLDPTAPPDGRGVVIALTFLCEDGHLFTYHLRFHKGMTFLERTVADAAQEVDLRPQTIWRN